MFCKKLRLFLGTWFGSCFLNNYHKEFSLPLSRNALIVSSKHKINCPLELTILSALKLTLSELVAFVDMNKYILPKIRNYETFLKESYAFALDSCYLFTKKMLHMELSMMLIILMEFAYIIYYWTLQLIRWIPCNLSRW